MARKSQYELNSPILSSSDDDEDSSESHSDSLPTATPNPPLRDDSDSGSHSDARSDSDSPDEAAIASKAIQVADPQSLSTGSGLKRKASEIGLNDSKQAGKKIAVEEEEEVEPKRKLFQRLWSDEDEISLLKGIMEYVKNKRVDPFGDSKAFRDSIQNSLHVEVNISQLQDKMRRLRKKFKNNARKVKPGKEKVFSKPHENEVFALSKKIWAPDGKLLGVESSKPNASTRNTKPNQIPPKSVGQNGMCSPSMFPIKLHPGRTVGDPTVEEDILVDGWKYIEGSKKLEIEEKWRKLHFEEMELSLKRRAFIKEHSELVLEGMKAKGI